MGETQKKEKKKIGLTTKIFIALLAGEIGMSQAQVSRLEKNALNSMKHYLE